MRRRLFLVLLSGFWSFACSRSGVTGDSGPPPYENVVIVGQDIIEADKSPTMADTLEGPSWDSGTADETSPGTTCAGPGDCPPERPFCLLPVGRCVECLTTASCLAPDRVCVENTCVTRLCDPGSRVCVGSVLEVCDALGISKTSEDCASSGLPCLDGACGPCIPGKRRCDGNQRLECAWDGMSYEVEDCGERVCVDGRCLECTPGMLICQGNDVMRCAADGSAWDLVERCDPTHTGLVCQGGACVSLCDKVLGERTNEGCEYWPLDLDQNYEFDAEDMQFAVIVSNTSDEYDATVRIERATGLEKEVLLPKGGLAIILLDPFNISEPGKGTFGRRLKSTVPIVAYQFNPLENVGVYSNDASMLLPTNALSKQYRVLTWKARDNTLASYFTIVAVEEGTTEVFLRVTAATQGGPGLPALPAGGETTVMLERFQTLHVKTSQACADLSGTLIEATRPVAVIAGHECANVPAGASCGGQYCCCDHLEDQIFPLKAWGKRYLMSRTWPRGQAPDTIRVLSGADGTQITVTGAPVTIPTLSASQVYEFEVTTDIELSSDQPFLAALFLASQTAPTGCLETCDDTLFFGKRCDGDPFGKPCKTDQDCCPGVAGIGDPAMIVAVPAEQFRKNYRFLVPNKYAKNYLNIIAPAAASVDLDGVPVPEVEFSPFPSGQFKVARLPVTEGVHHVASSQKVGIVVYGWDQYVSYGYAGGMNVATLY